MDNLDHQYQNEVKTQSPWIWTGIGIIILALVSLGYKFDFSGFATFISPVIPTGVNYQRAKTIWDWMGLLVVPGILLWGGNKLNTEFKKIQTEQEIRRETADRVRSEKNREFERWLEFDRSRTQSLQRYLESISKMLLERNLLEAPIKSPLRSIARAKTIDILRKLDGERKRYVLDFLYESFLLEKGKGTSNGKLEGPIVELTNALFGTSEELSGPEYKVLITRITNEFLDNEPVEANLRDIFLKDAVLSLANFAGCNFINANLTGCEMKGVNLNGAKLGRAIVDNCDFEGASMVRSNLVDCSAHKAKFISVRLNDAKLTDGDFSNADFTNADLRHADFTRAVLIDAKFKNAKLDDATLDFAQFDPKSLSEKQKKVLRSARGVDGI